VKELIYKRGYGKLNKARTPLTDNSIIEEVNDFEFYNTFLYGFGRIEDAIEIYKVALKYINKCHTCQHFELSFGFINAGSWQVWHHLH
jgi:large subunit ribosomal protein L7e